MISYQRETLFDVAAQVEPLLREHYDELTLNKDRVKLSPMWEEYAALEKMGRFVVFSARKKGELIGYAAFFLVKHLHYAATNMAINDVLFLTKDERRGGTGVKLVLFCEQELAKMGAHKITMHAKYDTPLGPLLRRMGYADEEMILAKLL